MGVLFSFILAIHRLALSSADLPFLTANDVGTTHYKTRACLFVLVEAATQLVKDSGKNQKTLNKLAHRTTAFSPSTLSSFQTLFYFIRALGASRHEFLNSDQNTLDNFFSDVDRYSHHETYALRFALYQIKKAENSFNWKNPFWHIGTHFDLPRLLSEASVPLPTRQKISNWTLEAESFFLQRNDPFLSSLFRYLNQNAEKIIYVLMDGAKIRKAQAYFTNKDHLLRILFRSKSPPIAAAISPEKVPISKREHIFHSVFMPKPPKDIHGLIGWLAIHFHELGHSYFTLLLDQWIRANIVLAAAHEPTDELFDQYVSFEQNKFGDFILIDEYFNHFFLESWSYYLETVCINYFFKSGRLSASETVYKIEEHRQTYLRQLTSGNDKKGRERFLEKLGVKNSRPLGTSSTLVHGIAWKMIGSIEAARKIRPDDFPIEYFPILNK